MRIAWIFVGFIAALWLYSIVVTEPPYGLDRTPRTVEEITLKNVREN